MTNFIYRWFGIPGAVVYIIALFEVMPLVQPHGPLVAISLGIVVCIAAMDAVVRSFAAWGEHLKRKAREK